MKEINKIIAWVKTGGLKFIDANLTLNPVFLIFIKKNDMQEKETTTGYQCWFKFPFKKFSTEKG